ncbi:MAG: phenylalanine--tRNA ligase subunit beta-related protein [Minisyncoccota bacterium]
MKITHAELQEYFAKPLPRTETIAEVFTFHAFEIESVEGDMLDIKVLPNRAADCNSKAGIALELSAILDLPLVREPELSYPGTTVAVTLNDVNGTLGADFSAAEMEDVFHRLRFKVEQEGDKYHVTAPAPRNDMAFIEDVAEEVGRIMGYERIPETPLPVLDGPVDQARYRGIERMKDQLVEQGFTEISTRSFAKNGDIKLANPLDKSKPALRTSLEQNLQEALTQAKRHAPLVLPPGAKPKLFEVGTVFPAEGEYLELRMTERVKEWGDTVGISDNLSIAKLEGYGKDYTPVCYKLSAYKPFSMYPFVIRDVALWVPGGTEADEIEKMIRKHASGLLARLDQFDRFEKEGRISYAFRLVFESLERTLTDDEVNGIMQKITAALTKKGYEVR